jgi:hypothetical protein
MLKLNLNFPRKKTCVRSARKIQNHSTETIDEWPTPRMARRVIDRFGDDVDTTIVYLNTNIQMYTDTDYEYMKRMCLLMVSETVLKYSYLDDYRLKNLKKIVIEKLSSCEEPHLKTYIQKLKQL